MFYHIFKGDPKSAYFVYMKSAISHFSYLNSSAEMSLEVGASKLWRERAARPQQGGNHGNKTPVHLIASVTLIWSVELFVLTYLLLTKEEGGWEHSKANLKNAIYNWPVVLL